MRKRDGGMEGREVAQTNQGQKIKEKEERRTEIKRQYEEKKEKRGLGSSTGRARFSQADYS